VRFLFAFVTIVAVSAASDFLTDTIEEEIRFMVGATFAFLVVFFYWDDDKPRSP